MSSRTARSDAAAAGAALLTSSVGDLVAEAHGRYAARRPKSKQRHQRALEVMPGGNTRSVLGYDPFPTAMARGEGCHLWDIDGHRYLDLCGEYTAGLFGHSDSRILNAVRHALERGVSLAAVGEAEAMLAQILCDRFPSLQRVRFTNSGTEANLMAITAARYFTKRSSVLVFKGGYHGSLLTFPVVGKSAAAAPFPTLCGTFNDTEGTVGLVLDNARDLAAVLVEPMMGSGGCITARSDFLRTLRDVTKDTGTVLIFDEVMTSRMSSGGQQKRLGIIPDLMTLGKYIAGGMSFGAFGGRSEIMEPFSGQIAHSGTFNNNVVSMAAGVVAMGEIFDGKAADELFNRGETLKTRLNELCSSRQVPLHFSGLGSLIAVQFGTEPVERPVPQTEEQNGLRELFFFDLLDAGFYLARRGMIALSLPTSSKDLDAFVSAVDQFIQTRRSVLLQFANAAQPRST
ncbi:MAG: aspartate aminotransferase family protein [Lautropia sp.]